MRRKPKGQSDAPLAPVPPEIPVQFVRQGPFYPTRSWMRRSALQEGDDRTGVGWRADPPSRVSARRDEARRRHESPQRRQRQDGADDGPLPIDVPPIAPARSNRG